VLLQHLRAFERGQVARGVGVEGEDYAAGDALEQFGMAVGEGRANRADHVALPGLMGHHNVHVSLDNDRVPGALYVRAGQVKAVEDGAFVEYRRLGRVEVLGHLPLVESAPAEAHRSAFAVADGEEEPVAEAVVVPALIPLGHQPGIYHLLRGEAPALQVIAKGVPRVGRVAYLEGLDGSRGEAALLGVGARLRGGGVVAEEVVVESGGGGAGLVQALSGAVLRGGLFAARLDLYPGPAGQLLQRAPEVDAICLHQEGKGVAVCPAAEAVVRAVVGIDDEGRGLFRVEGAEALEVAPRPRQLDGLPDHVLHGEAALDFGYDIIIRHMLTNKLNPKLS
jgi:hypothetical protein